MEISNDSPDRYHGASVFIVPNPLMDPEKLPLAHLTTSICYGSIAFATHLFILTDRPSAAAARQCFKQFIIAASESAANFQRPITNGPMDHLDSSYRCHTFTGRLSRIVTKMCLPI